MPERGALLFRASADNTRSRYLWLSLGLGFAAVISILAVSSHKPPNWLLLVMAAIYVAMFFTQRRVSVYQNGIHLPADSSDARSRFVAWSQVERFHWDGDILAIVPTSSVMAGSELGRSLWSAVWKSAARSKTHRSY